MAEDGAVTLECYCYGQVETKFCVNKLQLYGRRAFDLKPLKKRKIWFIFRLTILNGLGNRSSVSSLENDELTICLGEK